MLSASIQPDEGMAMIRLSSDTSNENCAEEPDWETPDNLQGVNGSVKSRTSASGSSPPSTNPYLPSPPVPGLSSIPADEERGIW